MTNANLSKDYDESKVNQSIFSTANEEFNMSIDPSSMQHIIARLTDLYNDPIVATVREIISNAIDATLHVDPENRQPIDITVPSTFTHEFSVTDHALGLTLDEVKHIYTRYGASTKRSDFSQIGAYGLGSKSPLSYTSSFNVRTAKDGYETELLISVEDGQNAVKVLSHNKTDKANYMSVIIPTREDDVDEFIKALYTYVKNPVKGITFNGLDVVAEKYSYEHPVTIPLKKLSYKGTQLQLSLRYNDNSRNNKYSSYMSSLSELVHAKDDTDAPEITGVLRGFEYPMNISTSYFIAVPHLIVELVPGLVDFSSSRDSITNTPRKKELVDTIIDYLRNHNEELVAAMINEIPNLFEDPDIARLHFACELHDYSRVFVDNDKYKNIHVLSNGKDIYDNNDLKAVAVYDEKAFSVNRDLPQAPLNSNVRMLKHSFKAYYAPDDFINDTHVNDDATTISNKALSNVLSTHISILPNEHEDVANNVLIMTGVHDAKTASKLVSSRNILSGQHYYLPDDATKFSTFVITEKSSDEMQRILDEYLIPTDNITIKTADETFALAKARRSAATSTRKNTSNANRRATAAHSITKATEPSQLIDVLDGSAFILSSDTFATNEDLKVALIGKITFNDILVTFNEMRKQNKKSVILYRFYPDDLRAYDKTQLKNDYDLVLANFNAFEIRSAALKETIKKLADHERVSNFTFTDDFDETACYKISEFNLALQLHDELSKDKNLPSVSIRGISNELETLINLVKPELTNFTNSDIDENPNVPIYRRIDYNNDEKHINITNQYSILDCTLDELVDLFTNAINYVQDDDFVITRNMIENYLAYKKAKEMFE